MVMQIYTVFDRVLEESGPVFEAKNHGVAARKFQNILQNTEYPNDFRMLHLGSIDHQTSVIMPLSSPDDVTDSIAFIESKEDSNG